MKKNAVLTALVLSIIVLFPAVQANAAFNFGFSASSTGANGFYMDVSDYNQIPEKEVVTIVKSGIPDEHLPVVLFLAKSANVAPEIIVKMRLGGRSWWQIASFYKLSPDVFYVPVNGQVTGRAYGNVYKFYSAPKKRWKKIVLSDDDVVNCVNLKFTSEYYNYAPEEVIKLREGGKTFINIHDDVKVKFRKNYGHDRSWYRNRSKEWSRDNNKYNNGRWGYEERNGRDGNDGRQGKNVENYRQGKDGNYGQQGKKAQMDTTGDENYTNNKEKGRDLFKDDNSARENAKKGHGKDKEKDNNGQRTGNKHNN